MEIVSFMIQGGIGSIFTIYGICSLLSNRKNQTKEKPYFHLSAFWWASLYWDMPFLKFYKKPPFLKEAEAVYRQNATGGSFYGRGFLPAHRRMAQGWGA